MNIFDGKTTDELRKLSEELWLDLQSVYNTEQDKATIYQSYHEVMQEIAIRSNEVTDESFHNGEFE